MNGSDEDRVRLTALIDNELAGAERPALLDRLSSDAALRAEHEALLAARGTIDAVFGALVDQAPLARLTAALPAPRRPAARRLAYSRIAAGFVVGALFGVALTIAVNLEGARSGDDWTVAVLNYMSLFSTQTFAPLHPDGAAAEGQLAALGAAVGVPLKAADVALPGLSYKVAFELAYERAPLAEIVFVDASGAPNVFCILADNSPERPLSVETRNEFSFATWSRQGRRFLVAGPAGAPVGQWARALTARL